MSLNPADRTRRGRTRVVAAVVILVAWVAALAGLVQRDVMRTDAERMAELALRVNPGNVFFAVEQDGRHIGWASSTIDTLPDTLVVRDALVADIATGGTSQRTVLRTNVVMSRLFALRSFTVESGLAGSPMHIRGRVDGDTGIVYVVETNGVVADTQRVRVQGPVLLPTLVPLAAILGGNPKVGRQVTYATFDPASMGSKSVTMRIDAESLFVVQDSAKMDLTTNRWVTALRDTVRAWRLMSPDGTGVTSWVDAQGRIVETTELAGIRLRRMAYELAFENWRLDGVDSARAAKGRAGGAAASGTGRDIYTASAISANVRLPARLLSLLRVRLTAPSLKGLDLRGGRQTMEGDVVTITRESDAALSPPGDAAEWGRIQTRQAAALRTEVGIEARAPVMLRQAVAITHGYENAPREAVKRLVRWVYDSLTKAPTISIPNAMTVLAIRRGDCNEHTQLFTALARAIRIPTRVAAGLAYVDGKFYYHAWPEVYLSDWVAVDPTWGQFPADASHIRLITGGLDRQAELLKLVGTLHIEVLEAR